MFDELFELLDETTQYKFSMVWFNRSWMYGLKQKPLQSFNLFCITNGFPTLEKILDQIKDENVFFREMVADILKDKQIKAGKLDKKNSYIHIELYVK